MLAELRCSLLWVTQCNVFVSLKSISAYHKNISWLCFHSLPTNINSVGERRNESKIYVLLIEEGYVFTAEVSFIPAWESTEVQVFKGLCFKNFACTNHVFCRHLDWACICEIQWPSSCLFIILLTEILGITLAETKPKQQNQTNQTEQ